MKRYKPLFVESTEQTREDWIVYGITPSLEIKIIKQFKNVETIHDSVEGPQIPEAEKFIDSYSIKTNKVKWVGPISKDGKYIWMDVAKPDFNKKETLDWFPIQNKQQRQLEKYAVLFSNKDKK